jgi:hypothetical protein
VDWPAVGVVLVAIAGQAIWIGRALDAVTARLDRIDGRLDRIEGTTLREHGERIARLEARADG